jgi:hypothetical protein
MPTVVLLWKPNAGCQPLPEAGATQEQRLEAVGCTPWFGADSGTAYRPRWTRSLLCPLWRLGALHAHACSIEHETFAPLSTPSPLLHRWAASADEPISLVQHHGVNRESQGFGDLQIDDKLNF